MNKRDVIIKNNLGFTLVELIATIVILALVMGISTYSISAIINNAKEKNYQLLINNIKDAAETYYQECKFNEYTNDIVNFCIFDDKDLITTLGELVMYGYLKSNDPDSSSSQRIFNPKDDEDITNCQIKITNNNRNITVEAIKQNETNSCPTGY